LDRRLGIALEALYALGSIVVILLTKYVRWDVDLHGEFVPEYSELNRDVQEELLAHIEPPLGIGQDGVSKLEKRADLMISTLRKTVEAMGGTLSLVAEFPDSEPVVVSGIVEEEPEQKHNRSEAHRRKHAHASV
jgi:hypothetical protein